MRKCCHCQGQHLDRDCDKKVEEQQPAKLTNVPHIHDQGAGLGSKVQAHLCDEDGEEKED